MKNMERLQLESRVRESLKNKLNIFVAPTGYGKTTLIRRLIRDENIFCLNITSEYNTSIKLCRKICLDVFGVDTYNQMRLINKKIDTENFLAAIMCVESMRRDGLALIIDDYEQIESTEINSLILRLISKIPETQNISFIISTKQKPHNNLFSYFLDIPDSIFDYDDFCFNRQEVYEFISINNFDFSDTVIDYIFERTLGWPLGVKLLACIQNGDTSSQKELNNYIKTNIYDTFSQDMKEFVKSASAIEEIPSGLLDYIKEPAKLRKEFGVITKNMYFIYKNESSFVFHPMLKEFLLNYSSNYNTEFSTGILEYFKAKKEYDQLFYIFNALNMKNETKKIAISLANSRFVERNRIKYFNLLNTLPESVIKKNKILAVNFARYSGYKLSLEKKLEYYDIGLKLYEKDDSIDENTKQSIRYEITLFKALSYNQDYKGMLETLKTVKNEGKKESTYFSTEYFRLNNPRVLFVYYRAGMYGDLLSKIKEIENIFSISGHCNCNGLTTLCKAEMHYLKGNLKNAEKLVEEALEESKPANQFSISIACYYLQVKIFKYENNPYLVEKAINSINYNIKRKSDEQKYILDVAKLWYYSKEGTLSDDSLLASYADMQISKYDNIITNLCKIEYLLVLKRYDDAIPEIVRIIRSFKNLNSDLGLLYSFILLSEIQYLNNNRNESIKLLLTAIKLASEDDIIMPFVERGEIMLEMLDNFESDLPITWRLLIIQKIKLIQKKEPVKKAENKFKLSKRELEVMELMKLGLKNTEIAIELGIKPDTVKEYIHNVFIKLGVTNRLEAVIKYKD